MRGTADSSRSGADPSPLDLSDELRLEARAAIVTKLGELVSWPASRIPPYDRQLAADILVGLLRQSSAELRARVADGLTQIQDAPKALLRYLARDDIQVSQSLLQNGIGFDDSDLIATVLAGITPHWHAIARRKALTEPVVDALVQTSDTSVIEMLLRNNGARFSAHAIDVAVARSRTALQLVAPLIQRSEVRPTQALVLFWWCSGEARIQVLRRFAADRSVLLSELGDIFALAAREGWADPEARKALQLIERRQRNRQAAERSPWGSLEGAVTRAEQGLDTALMHEIGHLAGIRPHTAQQILNDASGEPIAVLAKATGLKRGALLSLWKGLGRPFGDTDNVETPFGRMMYTYDILSNAKAQTVLRYWNWSFTAEATTAARMSEEDVFELSPAHRNAALLLRRGS